MKRIFLTLILFFCLVSVAFAAKDVVFKWDSNSEPDMAGYRIHQYTVSGEYSPAWVKEIPHVWDVSVHTTTLIAVPEGTWYWAVTAYDTEGLVSSYSNEVTATIENGAPSAPVNLRFPSEILVISNITIETYEVANLVNAELVYVDRTYTFTDVPGYLQGAAYIKTANDDKGGEGDSFLSFDVNQDVTVYVGYDIRISETPSWLLDFAPMGSEYEIATSDTTFRLFAKNFSADTVTLGGNNSVGNSMYTVIIVVN